MQFSDRTPNTYFEFPVLKPDGQRVWVGQNVQTLMSGDWVVGFQAVARDITERKKMRDELARARDAAVESARVKSEFLANVSHELRTPLTAIQGYLETLLGGALEERANARRFLEIAFRHTERLGRLLNDLTDLSNIELGKVSLRLAPVRFAEVLGSVLDIVRPKAEASRVGLIADVEPADIVAHADHDRLAQILINLVDNAVKYTPEGGWVTVRARRDGGRLEVRVRDTGIGIPRADLPRITERFYRVDKARSRELGGTGLGLAIVKHLVLAHGGELEITSEEGEGTTVRFTLAAAGAGADQLALPMEPPGE